MATGIQALTELGTKLWLDSVDPDLTTKNFEAGVTGATSNPIIIADLIKTGRFDEHMQALFAQGFDDKAVCWMLTDYLVKQAQEVFEPVSARTECNDGWVSFELDPLLEDVDANIPHEQRVQQYIALGKQWGTGHVNRMIKVPATPAGLESLEALAAHGLALNVTLVFSERQYVAARDAIWRGAQRRGDLKNFKSVYSIFISRVDVYTEKKLPGLSKDAQGMVGLVNAKQLWKKNQEFWADKGCALEQEIIFASTGKKLDWQDEDYYPAHLAGSDIQTNPPSTNDAIAALDKPYNRTVDTLPDAAVLSEIDEKVDDAAMERALMEEGLAKFADPMKKLIATVKEKRDALG
ncbi:MAG: transaldolase family protein [Planctomycetota bacterium]